jgi:hypothetical protein
MKYIAPLGVADPNAHWITGNPAAGVQGSIPPAEAFEHPLRELVALITAAGFTPDSADLLQIIRAVRQGVGYTVATAIGGNPNTLTVITTANGAPPITSYQVGLTLKVKIPALNTAAVTITVDGLSAVSIIRANGADVAAGDLPIGSVVTLVYDGTKFQITNYFGFSSTTTNNNNFTIDIPFADDTSLTPNIVTAAYSPAITSQAKGDIICTKLKNSFTGPATIAVNALAAKNIVRTDSTPTQRNDAFVNEMLLLSFDGTNYQIINQIGLPPAPALTANADWYVNGTTGNDSTLDGTSATVSGTHGPFKTIQRATTEIVKYNMNGYDQFIHIADGAYIGTIGAPTPNGAGNLHVIGNSATPANVSISCSTFQQNCITQSGGHWTYDGLRLTTTGSAFTCLAVFGGIAEIKNMQFGPASQYHLNANTGGQVYLNNGTITIEAGANAIAHLAANSGGFISYPGPTPSQWPFLVFTGGCSFSGAFITANNLGTTALHYQSITNAGAVGGSRYQSTGNSVIDSQGGGPSYYPGNVAGTVGSGGQYI